ncbi:rod shape-determining protein [Patescibacteria group bacterium]|nr:rod shape-determining protein [Patescibacteria group bacterium]MDE1946559.1 rod shape-determining protein [Patescibacteria group bacterium]MDE2010880.1 rod shape-determining protein [Patescibacteria group bacterium]MDE2232764.1 rod shape-determining protein [Patescibacteria group bacterium]
MASFKDRKDKFLGKFSNDIGIDLGTANTLVYVRGKGIVVNEPSVVAVNQKTGQVVAVGSAAKEMLGRTPLHITAVRPLVDGVISDFEVTEEMLSYLMKRAGEFMPKRFLGPRVVVGVPSGVTNVEVRAVRDAAKNAGAREVYIVEQPMAGAIGVRLPVHDPVGSMVVDIGGGTTDIAVISLGGIVRSKNLKIAGDKFNNDIITYIRNEFKILIGETTAEQVKIAVGLVVAGEPLETTIRGRDLITGLPREVIITDSDIREAMAQSVGIIVESAKEVLEMTPPEILSDIMKRGVHLVGGGALIKGLNVLLSEALKIPVTVADDPLTAIARGAGVILEDLDTYRSVLIESEDDINAK